MEICICSSVAKQLRYFQVSSKIGFFVSRLLFDITCSFMYFALYENEIVHYSFSMGFNSKAKKVCQTVIKNQPVFFATLDRTRKGAFNNHISRQEWVEG